MAKKQPAPRKGTARKAKAPAHQKHTEEQRERAAKRLGEQEKHSFCYDDLLALTDMKRNALYRHVYRGTLDPEKIESVLYWVARHGTTAVKRKLLDYALQPSMSKNPAADSE